MRGDGSMIHDKNRTQNGKGIKLAVDGDLIVHGVERLRGLFLSRRVSMTGMDVDQAIASFELDILFSVTFWSFEEP